MTCSHFHLILGSSSASRASVLKKLGIPFSIISPDIDESVLPNETPPAHVERLAIAKAQRVVEMLEQQGNLCPCREYWIIGSDQVAFLNGHPVSKPESHEVAVQQLLESSGKAITFFGGLCLWHLKTGQYQSIVDTTTTHYRAFTREHIDHYLAREKPYHCAGSLKSEGLGIALIERIDSKDPNSLIGLPLIDLCELFQKAGVDLVLQAAASA